jgi:hypothetical protein
MRTARRSVIATQSVVRGHARRRLWRARPGGRRHCPGRHRCRRDPQRAPRARRPPRRPPAHPCRRDGHRPVPRRASPAATLAGQDPQPRRPARAGLVVDGELHDVACFLHQRLLPHEQREEELARSALAKVVGGEDPLGAMRSTHLEIAHLAGATRSSSTALTGRSAPKTSLTCAGPLRTPRDPAAAYRPRRGALRPA